mgnify:FL=1
MGIRVAVVMDPIEKVKPAKDTTLALMEAAARAGFETWCLTLADLSIRSGRAFGRARRVVVDALARPFFSYVGEAEQAPLEKFDTIWMRKDPPFDVEYVVATYILEHAQAEGVIVVNDPQALRDANEKVFTSWFPELCPPTLITRSVDDIALFRDEHRDIIIKPLDGMGGHGVFHVREGDGNFAVIVDLLTAGGTRYTMAQRFIPEIADGDKRIILVDGQAMPYLLARIPAAGQTRGNLAAGGRGEVRPLCARDTAIAERVGPVLADLGLTFVGLDVIGDYLTEINVTSPTCVREIEAGSDADIADRFVAAIGDKLERR